MIVVVHCPEFLNHKGEMENDRQPSRLAQKRREIFFFLSSFLFIRFVSQEEASCCQGGQLNEAVGEMKGGGSACREVDRKEFPPICSLCSTFCRGWLAGQVLPLGCVHIHKCMLFITQTQQSNERAQDRGNYLCCFTACLFSLLLPLFFPLSFSLSQPSGDP